MNEKLEALGDDLWVKIVGMLQQNWASIEPVHAGVCVYFVSDIGDIFDEIPYENTKTAEAALLRNGFRRFREAPDLQSFLRAPVPPFTKGSHPNGPIYSSGRFWR